MNTADPNSRQISLRSSGFSQNGQIDWVSFLKGTAEATISILMRLSACGVEALTVLVAQKVFAPLRLSARGEQNVYKALSSLRAFGSFGNVLWFGFGVQHVTRSLAQTREGLGCVALCGVLAECFTPEVSALVLAAFADISNVPREVTPSLAQWRQLLQACGGCLAKSDFGDVVQKFVGPQYSEENKNAANPQDLAEALHGLTRVCAGELDSITFTGGPVCGWLGAVASWLLGFSVAVQLDDEATPISSGINANDWAQVRVVYTHRDTEGSSDLDIRKSYRITDISDLIKRELPLRSSLFCIRVPWETALRSTFGEQPLRNLTFELQQMFTAALGSAACLLELLVGADPGFSKASLQNNYLYREGTYGRGLLRTISCCFPEISTNTTSSAMTFLDQTFNDASMAYERAVFQLSAACPCGAHDKEHWGVTRQTGICLTALFEAIVDIARSKANMLVDEGLKPTQTGLLTIYRKHVGELGFPPVERLTNVERGNPIDDAAELYCGTCFSDNRGFFSQPAISMRGLCFYLETLCDTSKSPVDLTVVHVVPGSIQLDRRTYFEVRDMASKAPLYHAKRAEMITTVPDGNIDPSDKFTLEAIVMELESHISFGYQVSCRSGISVISPAQLSADISRGLGRICCSYSGCSTLGSIPPIGLIEGEGDAKGVESSITVRLVARNNLAWCIALSTRSAASNTVLRTRECLSCCLRFAMKYDECHVIYLA